MQKFFQFSSIIAISLSLFLLANKFFPSVFSYDVAGVNSWAGGIGGLLFGVLAFIIGGSEKASQGVAEGIKNIVTQIGFINNSTINNGDNREIPKKKKK